MIRNLKRLSDLNHVWGNCSFVIEGILAADLVELLESQGHTIYKKHNSYRDSFHLEKWYMRTDNGEEWRIGATPWDGIYSFRYAFWVREKKEREERRVKEKENANNS